MPCAWGHQATLATDQRELLACPCTTLVSCFGDVCCLAKEWLTLLVCCSRRRRPGQEGEAERRPRLRSKRKRCQKPWRRSLATRAWAPRPDARVLYYKCHRRVSSLSPCKVYGIFEVFLTNFLITTIVVVLLKISETTSTSSSHTSCLSHPFSVRHAMHFYNHLIS